MDIFKIKTFIPPELVDIIADYHDYHKYSKPKHQEKYKEVLIDIVDMGEVMESVKPRIAKECWGMYKPDWFSGSQEEWAAF